MTEQLPFLCSVVIPVRAPAPHLPQVLHALAGQQPPPHEVVVVDDHSFAADAATLRAQCEAAGARYQVNDRQGRSAARNLGIRLCSGRTIFFLDADQELPKGFLRALEPAAVQWNCVSLPEENVVRDFCSRALQAEYAIWFYGTGRDIPRVYAAEWVRRAGGFDESLEFGEDWDLAERVRALGATSGGMEGPRILHHAHATWRAIGRKHFQYARFARALRQKHGKAFGAMYRGWNPRVAENLKRAFRASPGTTLAALVMRAYKYACAALGWMWYAGPGRGSACTKP